MGFEPTSADANRFAGGSLGPLGHRHERRSGGGDRTREPLPYERSALPTELHRRGHTLDAHPSGASGSRDLRRGRDSNPRARLWASCFRNRRDCPLRHLSVVRRRRAAVSPMSREGQGGAGRPLNGDASRHRCLSWYLPAVCVRRVSGRCRLTARLRSHPSMRERAAFWCCGSGRIRTSERARGPLPPFQDGAINRTLPRFPMTAERVGFEPTVGSVARLLGSNEAHLSALAPLRADGGSGGIRTHGPSCDSLRFSRPAHLSALARFLVVATTGIEPMTSRVSDGRSNQLSYVASIVVLAGGIEPPQ